MASKKSLPSTASAVKAWLAVIFTAMFFFYWLNQNSLNGPLDDHYIVKYHLKGVMAYSTFTSMYLIGCMLMLIPAGLMLDKFSTKRVLQLTMSVMLLGVLGLILVHRLVPAVCFMLIVGCGGAFPLIAVVKIVANWFVMEKSAFPITIAITLGMFGGVYGSSVGSFILQHSSADLVQITNFILGVIILIAMTLFVQDKPQGICVNQSSHETASLSMGRAFLTVLLNPQNWLAGSYTSLLNFPIMVLVFSAGNAYVIDVFGENLRNIAPTAMSALLIGTMIGGPVLGKISDKMRSRQPLMILLAILAVLIMLPMYDTHLTGTELISIFFIMGLITSAQNLGYPVVGESNDPTLVATAMSVVSIMIMGGGAVAQNVFGWLTNHFGYQGAYTMLPVCAFIAFILALFIKNSRQVDRDRG